MPHRWANGTAKMGLVDKRVVAMAAEADFSRSGPNDWLAQFRGDSAAPTDVPRPGKAHGPIVISNRAYATLDPEDLRRNRWNVLERHFLYFYANATSGLWDWFEVTAGAQTLRSRFGEVQSSPRTNRTARRR